MKRISLLLAAIITICCLTACGENVRTTKMSNEKAENTVVSVENVGGSIDMDEDSAKTLLGIYSSKELGIKGDIDEYTLVITSADKKGISGAEIKAYDPEADVEDDEPEATFIISGTECYKYDAKTKKYVSLSGKGELTTQKADKKPANKKTTVADDVSFPYHKGNNDALQERFAKYDLSAVGLKKDISNYVFVITARTGTAADGSVINIVELYEKDGTDTGITFGVGASDYRYDEKSDFYVQLS